MNPEEETDRLPVVLTVTECAKYLRIARGHAYTMVNEGRIPSIRMGRRILIPRAALERMPKDVDDEAGGQPQKTPETRVD